MNKAIVLYSNYVKFEFEMIDNNCIIDNNIVSISDALEYAKKMSYPYNILRGDIFKVDHVLMPDGKNKDIYTLLENIKVKEDDFDYFDEVLNSQDFYDIMQEYRHSSLKDQHKVSKSFENVKNFIKERLYITNKKNII